MSFRIEKFVLLAAKGAESYNIFQYT
jgi:hypothetical protein